MVEVPVITHFNAPTMSKCPATSEKKGTSQGFKLNFRIPENKFWYFAFFLRLRVFNHRDYNGVLFVLPGLSTTEMTPKSATLGAMCHFIYLYYLFMIAISKITKKTQI